MAVGLLWFFWLALLVNCSAGFSSPRAPKQSVLDGQNQLDEQDMNALAAGEGDGNVVDNQPSGPVLARYQWPTVAKPPSLAPSVQNKPDTIDQPEPQTLPVNVESASVANPIAWEYAGQRNEVANPIAWEYAGQRNEVANPIAWEYAGQRNEVANPIAWEYAGQRNEVANPIAWEHAGQSNEVESPTVQVSPPQKPSSPKLVGQPSYKDWMSMPFNDIFDQNLFDQFGFQPENSVRYETHLVPVSFPQMPYRPVPPPPRRQRLTRKSKNGYHRERLQQSKDIYLADPRMQQMTGSRKFNPLPKKVLNRQHSHKM